MQQETKTIAPDFLKPRPLESQLENMASVEPAMDFSRPKPKVSIVIPSWFAKGQDGRYGQDETFKIAKKCLDRLIEKTPKELYELILIDNGSENLLNDTLAVPNFFSVADLLIRNSKNLGFANSCNQGFALARGEYICCVNNDIYCWEGWLEALLAAFEGPQQEPPIGMLMPNTVKPSYQKDCLRDDGSGKLDIEKVMKLKKEEVNLPRADQLERGAEFGSCWMAHRELLKEVAKNRDGYQVFDEKFLLGMGEDRWAYREIRMLGYETYRVNATRVLHVGNMTISKIPNKKDYTTKNREYLAELKKKHNID